MFSPWNGHESLAASWLNSFPPYPNNHGSITEYVKLSLLLIFPDYDNIEFNPVTYFLDCLLTAELLKGLVGIHLLAIRSGSEAKVAILQDQWVRLVLDQF